MRVEAERRPHTPTFSELRTGDEKVWEKFYKDVKPRLVKRAVRVIGPNNAEDVVESTLISVYSRIKDEKKPPLKEFGNPAAYVEISLTNNLRDTARKAMHPATPVLLPEFKGGDGNGDLGAFFDRQADVAENVEQVVEAGSNACEEVTKLQETFSKNTQWAKILVLTAEGYSYKEIAEELDIPLGSVMSGLNRARKKARESAAEIFDREVVDYHVSHLRKSSDK